MNDQARRLREEVEVARKAILALEAQMALVREILARTARAVDDAIAADTRTNAVEPGPNP